MTAFSLEKLLKEMNYECFTENESRLTAYAARKRD